MPSLSLLVGVYNPPALTANFLHWLKDVLSDEEIEAVIVCDGDNNRETHRLLRSAKSGLPRVRVLFRNTPAGVSVAYNTAAREASGRTLLFMNTDTFPAPGAPQVLAKYVVAHDDVAVAQGLLVYPQSLRVQSAGHIFGPFFNRHALAGRHPGAPIVRRPADRQALTSAFYAVRRDLFLDNGGFDEFYLNSFEGMEFALRMSLQGYRCAYRPEALCYHVQGGSRRHVPRDERQQLARFWSLWGSRLKCDLDDILSQQLDPSQAACRYLTIDVSSNRCWETTLKKLDLTATTVASLAVTGRVVLQETVVPEIHRSQSPLLFLTDHFSQVADNALWFRERGRGDDIILDCHGNVVTPREVVETSP